MAKLAAEERFEEAAHARDRLRALTEALSRARTDAWLTRGRISVRDGPGIRQELHGGALDGAEPLADPCPRDRADELATVRSWILRRRPTLVDSDEPIAEPVDGGGRIARLLGVFRSSRG
jgi:hypothetical protein